MVPEFTLSVSFDPLFF